MPFWLLTCLQLGYNVYICCAECVTCMQTINIIIFTLRIVFFFFKAFCFFRMLMCNLRMVLQLDFLLTLCACGVMNIYVFGVWFFIATVG